MIRIEVKATYKFDEPCDEPSIRYTYCNCYELLYHLQDLQRDNWIPVATHLCDEYGRYIDDNGNLLH